MQYAGRSWSFNYESRRIEDVVPLQATQSSSTATDAHIGSPLWFLGGERSCRWLLGIWTPCESCDGKELSRGWHRGILGFLESCF